MHGTLVLPPHDRLRTALPYAALLGSIVAFCIGTSFAKQLFPLIGAEATTAYRAGFSALILLLIWRPWLAGIGFADLMATARYGAAMGAMNLCFYMALRTIPLGIAIAIEFLGPLAVALLASRRPAQFAMVAMACAGLLLLLPIRPADHALDPTGVLFALGAGAGWALYIVFGKRTSHLHSGQSVALGMTTAAVLVVPIGLHQAGAALFAPGLMLLGLATAILSSAIPYSLEMVALKQIPSNSFGVLLSVEPAIGALTGATLLGEQLNALQWLAIALVVGASIGMILLTRPERRLSALGEVITVP